jgi:hypothetical protein
MVQHNGNAPDAFHSIEQWQTRSGHQICDIFFAVYLAKLAELPCVKRTAVSLKNQAPHEAGLEHLRLQ